MLLFNHGELDFNVNEGDRVAQLIIERIMPTVIQEVNELSSTARNAGGFGSTGINEEAANGSKGKQ